MSAIQSDLVKAAKQGNPKAIAALMSRSLKPKGIDVKAIAKGNRLNIVFESAKVPPQQTLVQIAHKGIESLGVSTIKTVKVHGRQTGSASPSWAEEFSLSNYVEPETVDGSAIVVTAATVHPVQPSQPYQASSRPAKMASYKAKPSRLPWIIASSGAAVFALVGLMGSIFWLRSTQSNAISDAEALIEAVGQAESPNDISALEADRENLQSAIAVLEKAPTFPLISVGALTTELESAQAKLAEVEDGIATYEALLPKIQAIVDQFSALDSGLDVGMNYRDYGAEVRELKVAIDRLGREPGASDHAVFTELESAYTHYEFAYDVWNYYIESDSASNSFFPADSSYGRTLINHYDVEPTYILSYRKIYLDTALSTVWNIAGQAVESAQAKL
jgi:hypothetical protein